MPSVLIVDDERLLQDMMALTLKHAGYEVFTASDGREALQLCGQRPFDVVITDLLMPEKDGIELLLQLRKQQPAPRTIAVSGGGCVGAEVYLRLAESLGVAKTLRKPCSAGQLLAAVSGSLAGS